MTPNFKGNATKTNLEVNETIKTTSVLGKTFLVAGAVQSTITIATSPTPVKEAVTEGAGWAGAMYGGAQGSTLGAVTGGPYGAFLVGLLEVVWGSS